MESCGSHTGFPVATSGRVLRAVAPRLTPALAGRCVVRPVDALTTATARVVPFAYACDDVWHLEKAKEAAAEMNLKERLVVRHVIIFGYGHGLQRAIIDESQHAPDV